MKLVLALNILITLISLSNEYKLTNRGNLS
jgi:hypothetical protein